MNRRPPNPSPLVAETETIPLPGDSTLLLRNNIENEVVALDISAPFGARDEPCDKAGLTTLALQMLSRGTERRSDYEIAVALESIGAAFSTDAGKDRVSLRLLSTAPNFTSALEIVREMLSQPAFPPDLYEVEKDILVKEIREDLDSPLTAAFRLFQKNLFENHPYGHPSSGTAETVSALERDEVRNHLTNRFGQQCLSLGLVGNLAQEEVLPPLERLLESLPEVDLLCDTEQPAAPGHSASVCEERDTEAECLVYGFPVPGFRDPRYPAWKILDSIVGGSMDSRLFSEFREKRGLVYQIGSTLPPLEWQSYFAIYLTSTPDNHAEILECLQAEIDRLKDTVPDSDEVERARRFLKGTFLMSQERNADQAHLLSRYHSLGLGIDFIDRYPRMLDEVSPQDIQQVAGEYLNDPLLAVVGPTKK